MENQNYGNSREIHEIVVLAFKRLHPGFENKKQQPSWCGSVVEHEPMNQVVTIRLPVRAHA